MDKTKQTLLIAMVAVLAVMAGGWFLLVSPQRANVSSLNAQRAAQDTTNLSLQGKITALKAELVEVPEATAKLDAIAARLPADLSEVSLIQTLSKAAKDANVDLQVITPGSPTLVSVAAPAAVVTTAAPAAGSATGTGAAAGAAAPAPASAGNLYAVPLGLTVQGDYFDIEMFVHNLEGMQRALLVSNLSLAKSATGTSASGASAPASATTTGSSAVNGATTTTTASKGTATTTKATGKTGAKSSAGSSKVKPVPGSAAAAQKAANALPVFVPNGNTLTVTIAASVFSLYTSTPAAASVPTTPPAATTSAPTK